MIEERYRWKIDGKLTPDYNKLLACLFGVLIVYSYLFGLFLEWNESREGGVQLSDALLAKYEATKVSGPLFVLTYGGVIFGILHSLRDKKAFFQVLVAAFSIITLRMLCLYFVHLEVPQGIKPLRDFFLEGTFYSGQVMEKDLFFSGHTANVCLLAFLASNKWIKGLLFTMSACIGVLVLVQKVHYTIDVIAAPFFAWLAYTFAIYLSERFLGPESPFR